MTMLISALMFSLTAFMAPAVEVNASKNDPVEISLSDLRWENRVLLIFTDNLDGSAFTEQIRILDEASDGLEVRKLVRFVLIDDGESTYEGQPLGRESAERIKSRYADSEPFTLILIGKDGGEKLRSHEPVTTGELFPFIDRMPMREREIREGQ
ncbi:MAG: DUF4174 domain-containing protein [Balneolia bacterium]|nr:DUF4174 domain-containing protein [Balneolia bacterium]